jgi:protein tyrosine/serine phosphatase/predicted nucleotidyltransferase
MEQLKIINELKQLLLESKHIETAFLYGSFARQNPTVNSDIDIATVVSKDFEVEALLSVIQKHFSAILLKTLRVDLRNKIVLYFNELPKAEIAFYQQISEHDRNYLGSEIPLDKISASILFDRKENAFQHFQAITVAKENAKDKIRETETSNLINKFVYEFESCSNSHRRSDGYHFYFFYNIALQIAIQLNHLSKGQTKFNFLPKNFIASVLTKVEQKDFYSLRGSLFLPEANEQKRKLLDFFYSSVQSLLTSEKLIELKQFCETIYSRDFLWNFRDISLHNSKIKSGLIYRAATMTLFQNENFFEEFIIEKKIKTVIDLRAKKEVTESNYTENSLKNFAWVHTPFDPWNQSIEFQATFHQGTDIEIAYRFFVIECKHSIKKAVEAILQEQNSTAIHCYAGKDRTGIFISMLHLLSGAELETVYNDYLATEIDTKKEFLNIALDIINQENGIENYLLSCGLNENQLSQLKQKLLR